MKDWKIIAVSAALAFVFSFISGLLGGVSLGVLLFRAIFGAVIFGAMGFGMSLILRRFLPEVFELQSGSSTEIDEDLSQMQQQSYVSAESGSSTENKPVIDISIGDETEKSVSDAGFEYNSNSSRNELVDEIVELDNADETDGNGQVPENIDVLPDMEVFSNSFENAEDTNGDGASSSGAVTLDIMGEEQDPELVAKALRTMVKKDQEG